MAGPQFIIEPNALQLSVQRDFQASVERLFAAYTQPELLVRWWGQAACSIQLLELRPGGRWRFVQQIEGEMHGFHGVFHTLTPDLIVQTYEYEGTPGHVQLDTIRLQQIAADQTRLQFSSLFQSVENRDGALQAGWRQDMATDMELLARLVEVRSSAV